MPTDFEAIVVGKLLAEEMQLRAGDYVTVTSPTGRLTPFGVMPRSQRFRVAGIFDSGFYDYDARWGFTTLAAVQSLAGVGDVASVIEFRVTDVDRAEETAARYRRRSRRRAMRRRPGPTKTARCSARLRLEKLVTALFIGLITFVAGLNILVVLAMTVTDRAHDIAVLMAMGARREQIRARVSGAGIGGGRNWHDGRAGGRLRNRLDGGRLSTDSTRSADLLGALRAVRSEHSRCAVDCRRRRC